VQQRLGTADAWARDSRTAGLEAVLFLAREPVSSRKLAQFAGLADGTEARTLIRRLNRWYDETGSAFRAEELAGGFQLLSRPQFGAWLRRLYESPVEIRLSAPALETLAVVAYRQPVLRAEIDAIRGVDCGEILRQLMDRDLLRTAGRADELGRPYRYATTKRFLQVFGLRHLDDLPRADLLRTPPTRCDTVPEQTENLPSRASEIDDNLARTNDDNEEEFERDHHRPA
jgi:segregation and condensation protein B